MSVFQQNPAMQKTRFHISRMDCSAEEQLIRLRLAEVRGVESLQFDLGQRWLDVVHRGPADSILAHLDQLGLDTSLIGTEQWIGNLDTDAQTLQTRILRQVLVINLFFFVVELIAGFLARSMGLAADGLDMLADSLVYGLALYAVSGTPARKKQIARASGYTQLVLAILGFVEISRRFIGGEEMPSFQAMVLVSLLALLGNAACLWLLQKSRSTEVHMRASMIFTSNDVIANIGVILAGALVLMTGSRLPDLMVGSVIFAIVTRGAFKILSLSR